jgi:hypothetical protein
MRILLFAALVLTALAFAPGAAHLFALPNKIGLSQSDYFIAQGIYRGWALLGFVLFGALFTDLALAVAAYRRGRGLAPPLVAVLCMVANLAIFFVWTFPANQATANWTVQPANWAALRLQWEYSHAVNALLTFVAFCALAWSATKQG